MHNVRNISTLRKAIKIVTVATIFLRVGCIVETTIF